MCLRRTRRGTRTGSAGDEVVLDWTHAASSRSIHRVLLIEDTNQLAVNLAFELENAVHRACRRRTERGTLRQLRTKAIPRKRLPEDS